MPSGARLKVIAYLSGVCPLLNGATMKICEEFPSYHVLFIWSSGCLHSLASAVERRNI